MYDFTWNEYCDWYLELSKPVLTGDADAAAQRGTRRTLVRVLEALLRLLHPLMPFITEEIWQKVAPLAGATGRSIALAPWPTADSDKRDEAAEADVQWLQDFILGVRRIRGEMDIAPSKPIPVLLEHASQADTERLSRFEPLIAFLARTESVTVLTEGEQAPEAAMSLLGSMRILVPMAGLIDKDAELARLEKQIAQSEGDVKRSEAKLGNERFVARAPEAVVNQERERLEQHRQTLAELKSQRERIAAL